MYDDATVTRGRWNLYQAALDADELFNRVRDDAVDHNNIYAYLVAWDKARHARDEAWRAYHDSVLEDHNG
jgi:hypothetical protein